MAGRSLYGGRWAIALCCALLAGAAAAAPELRYHTQQLEVRGERHPVRLPQGTRLELVTGDLRAPRLLSFAENGELFIGSRSGDVYRLRPPYERPEVLIHLEDYPHGVALRPGEILIATTTGLYRAPYRSGQGSLRPRDLSLLAALPGGGSHTSRSVGVGPDGRIYLSLGISGNCSDEYLDPSYPFERRRGGVLVLREDREPATWETYASGLRNPVGFAWHPQTKALYATNNGPDHWGYDLPPEYLSRLEPGSFHGMPWFQYDGERLRRDRCIEVPPPRPAEQVSLPVASLPARSAPMGIAFVPQGALGPGLAGEAVVALHGSWATRPTGGPFGPPSTRRPPALVLVDLGPGAGGRVTELVSGFQREDGVRWARPVGLGFGPDGALYFTSDEGLNGLLRLRRTDEEGR